MPGGCPGGDVKASIWLVHLQGTPCNTVSMVLTHCSDAVIFTCSLNTSVKFNIDFTGRHQKLKRLSPQKRWQTSVVTNIKILNLAKWDKSQLGNLVGNSLVGICLTLPNLGILWVFFKYPKISKNGNPLFFPVLKWQSPQINWLNTNFSTKKSPKCKVPQFCRKQEKGVQQ